MKTIYLFFVLLFTPIPTFGQYSISIEIIGLRNNDGNVLYELFDQNHKSIKLGTTDILNKKCSIVIENLKSGKYAFNYIHDENKNKKLDTKMLFIPKEGFGYSNNVDAKFGPPAFDKWLFEFKENTKLSCKVTYLNY